MISDILTGLNFWLIVLFTGALIWLVRQLTPDHIENTRVWKVVLKAAPALIGAGLACCPQIRPVDNLVQAMFVGFIGGTFSQTAYGLLREMAPEKIRSFMGSRSERVSIPPEDNGGQG